MYIIKIMSLALFENFCYMRIKFIVFVWYQYNNSYSLPALHIHIQNYILKRFQRSNVIPVELFYVVTWFSKHLLFAVVELPIVYIKSFITCCKK